MSRQSYADVFFQGVDISKDLVPFLLTLSYTDNEDDQTDDLQIKLQDRDDLWMHKWILDAVDAACRGGHDFYIEAVIHRLDWDGGGSDETLYCGQFELDSVSCSGPPQTVTIKATSLPYSAPIRQTKKTKAWEAYSLSGIAQEMAGTAGMSCMYLSSIDPQFEREEQTDQSDIVFLTALAHDWGLSVKATNKELIVFDQQTFEQMPSVMTLVKKGGAYSSYKLGTTSADTQYKSCRCRYVKPNGELVEGKYTDDSISGSDQQLEIWREVQDPGTAEQLAKKALRLHNKFSRTASFTIPGNTNLVAGANVDLKEFGPWDSKYCIKQAKHSIGTSGYETSITLRDVLEF